MTVRLLPVLLAIAVSGFAAAQAAAPAAAAAKRCGRVYVPARRAKAKVRVVVGSESCGAAKRLIGAALTQEMDRHWNFTNPVEGAIWRVSGWDCGIALGKTQTFCLRGRRRVDGSLRSDDAWSFLAG